MDTKVEKTKTPPATPSGTPTTPSATLATPVVGQDYLDPEILEDQEVKTSGTPATFQFSHCTFHMNFNFDGGFQPGTSILEGDDDDDDDDSN
uniref:Uncharacterized protein n=1 Tax=viral metagenome TaxID=1070528 RepID=A0A6C0BPF0_9ZZZZ